MSKQDSQSTQSHPVDDIEQSATQQVDGENAASQVVEQQGVDASSDSASVEQASSTGASESSASQQASSISANAGTPNPAIDPASSASTVAGAQASAASSAGGAAAAAGGATAAVGLSSGAIAAIVIGALLVVAVVAGVVAYNNSGGQQGGDPFANWYDNGAKQGQFEGKSQEEIQKALNEEVKKGMMNISIAAVITFPDGNSEGEARIENIASNPMDQKVTITLEDTGETVYESGALAPDQHIQTIKLSKSLAAGEYKALATFTGYDRETHKQTGQAAAKITLSVTG